MCNKVVRWGKDSSCFVLLSDRLSRIRPAAQEENASHSDERSFLYWIKDAAQCRCIYFSLRICFCSLSSFLSCSALRLTLYTRPCELVFSRVFSPRVCLRQPCPFPCVRLHRSTCERSRSWCYLPLCLFSALIFCCFFFVAFFLLCFVNFLHEPIWWTALHF